MFYIYLLIGSAVLFVITSQLLKLFIANAQRFSLMDIPNERSAHTKPVARGAGMVFGTVFMVTLLLLHFFFSSYMHVNIYVILSLFVIYLAGVYDDFNDIDYKTKFLFIIGATIIVYYNGIGIHSLGHYFGYDFKLGYFALPFTIFALAGFTNALNLTDGLDGLAGSISIVIAAGLLYIGIAHADHFLILSSLSLIAVLLAFLRYNWYPAKVFMGDSGSLFLGFVLGVLAVYALRYIHPISGFFLAAIPLLDTLMVMKRRKQRGQSLFVADKNHLHHILLKMKGEKKEAVRVLIKWQILFTLIFVQVSDKSDLINALLFALLFRIFFKLFDPRMDYRKREEKLRNNE